MARQRRASAGTPADLVAELDRIAHLPVAQARSRLLTATGKPPSPELSGDLLRRMLSHRAQEQVLGGLDRQTTAMLDRLADGRGAAPAQRLKPGCVLMREHGGVLHQVMVLRDGFGWQGQVLPSLSAIALAITGTHWNGNRFFGLDRRRSAARAGADASGTAVQRDCQNSSGMRLAAAGTRSKQPIAEAHA